MASSTLSYTVRATNIILSSTVFDGISGGSRGFILSPGIGTTRPTNYLFNTVNELTNIHTILSLQNSNTPVFEVDGIGDLKLLKRVAYSWPDAQGAVNTLLTNDGSGNLGWGLASIFQPASTALTNWSLYPTNVWNNRQGGSLVLTNLAGTGAITNLFSPTLSNTTIKPLVVGVGDAAGATNTTGHIRGLEAGSNITLTENGSNIVVASTASGGGLATNANQFGAQVTLTIKEGALLTNLLVYPTNLTGPAMIVTASPGQGTNLVEWRQTNGTIGLAISSNGLQVINSRLDLANSIAFRTNQLDFKLNQYQAFTASLKTNLVLQITNANEGVTTVLHAYGAGKLGGGLTNAWNLLCTAPTGFNIYWPPGTTNGNFDVLVNSNQVCSLTFTVSLGSTNILASYRILELTGVN